MAAKFELISNASVGACLPVRKTAQSAGYDFVVSKKTIVPSYACKVMGMSSNPDIFTLEEAAKKIKNKDLGPVLVPTEVKCKLDPGTYLELSVRSSTPLKSLLVLANSVGIIDADYYNNPDNEGHIYFQVLNLSPFDIVLSPGDRIGQGIIKKYELTEDDIAEGERVGGFGSTTDKEPLR